MHVYFGCACVCVCMHASHFPANHEIIMMWLPSVGFFVVAIELRLNQNVNPIMNIGRIKSYRLQFGVLWIYFWLAFADTHTHNVQTHYVSNLSKCMHTHTPGAPTTNHPIAACGIHALLWIRKAHSTRLVCIIAHRMQPLSVLTAETR